MKKILTASVFILLSYLIGLATVVLAEPGDTLRMYFPHIASDGSWETEICIINNSSSESISGTLMAYDNSGQSVSSSISVSLSPQARRQITVGDEFSDASQIGYIIFDADSSSMVGYTKFYIDGTYRVAVPAVSEVNTGDIYISHIASTQDWWTGISLVNTNSSSVTMTIEFDNGETKTKTLSAGEHSAFTINSLFGGVQQADINSAVIKNASGVIGLELFGSTDSSGNNWGDENQPSPIAIF